MKKLIKECRSCGSEEYTGNAPCTCVYEERFQTIIDKNGKYVIIEPRILYKEYDLAHCDVPELFSMEATLEGIDRYHHHKLMAEFGRMECKLVPITIERK